MRFLDITWTWDWCREHGFPLDKPEGPVAPRLAADPTLLHRECPVHSAASDPAKARELAANLVATLGDWDECLAWATDWDVWPSGENWPRYYAWRDRFGERRSLAAAPGHVFNSSDAGELSSFLAHVLECGWDVTLLPSRRSHSTGLRVRTSHDEWIELLSAAPISAASLLANEPRMPGQQSGRRRDTMSRIVEADANSVWQAFADPQSLMAWLPPGQMTGRVLEYDFREGGRYRIELTYDDSAGPGAGKTTGRTDISAGRFLSLEPAKRIVQTVEFESDDVAFAGEMLMTWSFEAVPQGTRVTITADNVPPGISKADHDAGLRGSLDNLASFLRGINEFCSRA